MTYNRRVNFRGAVAIKNIFLKKTYNLHHTDLLNIVSIKFVHFVTSPVATREQRNFRTFFASSCAKL